MRNQRQPLMAEGRRERRRTDDDAAGHQQPEGRAMWTRQLLCSSSRLQRPVDAVADVDEVEAEIGIILVGEEIDRGTDEDSKGSSGGGAGNAESRRQEEGMRGSDQGCSPD